MRRPALSGKKVHVLIPLKGVLKRVRGGLSVMRQVRMVSVITRNPEAPWVATRMVRRQNSAEGITRKRVPGSVRTGRRPERRSEERSFMSSTRAMNPTGGATMRRVMEATPSILSISWTAIHYPATAR